MRVGSLFAGIGGFDLAARWMGWETAWYSEIEPYACKVMQKHFPQAINHGDITQIKGADVEPVDILVGGFPCQDISTAGKGAGIEGARSGLWAHFARLIGELRPRWIVIENVAQLRSRGLDRVLKDLAALRYDAEWHCIPASAVGAPHRRDRIWIIAHMGNACGCGQQGHFRWGAEQKPSDGCSFVPNTNSIRTQVSDSRELPAVQEPGWHRSTGGPGDGNWWATEPNVGRVAYGVPQRVDRLRCLGNAIVPQVAYEIFRMIDTHSEET
jgi:DNA (cytosine-5)-methyltransferase 1